MPVIRVDGRLRSFETESYMQDYLHALPYGIPYEILSGSDERKAAAERLLLLRLATPEPELWIEITAGDTALLCRKGHPEKVCPYSAGTYARYPFDLHDWEHGVGRPRCEYGPCLERRPIAEP